MTNYALGKSRAHVMGNPDSARSDYSSSFCGLIHVPPGSSEARIFNVKNNGQPQMPWCAECIKAIRMQMRVWLADVIAPSQGVR